MEFLKQGIGFPHVFRAETHMPIKNISYYGIISLFHPCHTLASPRWLTVAVPCQ